MIARQFLSEVIQPMEKNYCTISLCLLIAASSAPRFSYAASALVCNAHQSRCYGASTWASKPDAIDEAMGKCRKVGGECTLVETTDQPCIGWFRSPKGAGLHSVGPSYTYVVNDGTRRCHEMAGQECATEFIYCN